MAPSATSAPVDHPAETRPSQFVAVNANARIDLRPKRRPSRRKASVAVVVGGHEIETETETETEPEIGIGIGIRVKQARRT